MIENHFKTSKTVRVFSNTNEFENIEFVWIALHGYGQLATYFSKNFEQIDARKHLIIIPEAQSRFYLNGVGLLDKKVGATWMTKEDRETDIEDYVNYLDALKASYETRLPKQVKWIVFGFSQGAATACRWVQMGNIYPAHLVLYAGIFPSDLNLKEFGSKEFKTWQLRGDNDEFWNNKTKQANTVILDKLEQKPISIEFKGKHKIYAEVLNNLVNRIENT